MMFGTHVLPPTNACTGRLPVRLLMRYEQTVASGSSLIGMWQLWQVSIGACENWLCCHSANVRSIGNGWPVSVPSLSLSVFSGPESVSGVLTLWQLPQMSLC